MKVLTTFETQKEIWVIQQACQILHYSLLRNQELQHHRVLKYAPTEQITREEIGST